MLSNPILFIALFVSFIFSLTYFGYFLNKMDKIKINDKIGKFKKFILLFLFPIISVFLILGFIVILMLINPYLTFVGIGCGVLYLFGMGCIFDDAPYWGILLICVSILVSLGLFFVDCSQKEFDSNVTQIKLYNYTDDVSAKEELLILLKDKAVTSTTSSTTSTENTNNSNSNLELYSFKKYNKLEGYELPFLFVTTEYEIIDDTNEILEITTKTIEVYNVYSYFGFYKPTITHKDEYKFFINENSIRLNKH